MIPLSVTVNDEYRVPIKKKSNPMFVDEETVSSNPAATNVVVPLLMSVKLAAPPVANV
jgi:hypothetical protein